VVVKVEITETQLEPMVIQADQAVAAVEVKVDLILADLVHLDKAILVAPLMVSKIAPLVVEALVQ
jgi:hypothetical protein